MTKIKAVTVPKKRQHKMTASQKFDWPTLAVSEIPQFPNIGEMVEIWGMHGSCIIGGDRVSRSQTAVDHN